MKILCGFLSELQIPLKRTTRLPIKMQMRTARGHLAHFHSIQSFVPNIPILLCAWMCFSGKMQWPSIPSPSLFPQAVAFPAHFCRICKCQKCEWSLNMFLQTQNLDNSTTKLVWIWPCLNPFLSLKKLSLKLG